MRGAQVASPPSRTGSSVTVIAEPPVFFLDSREIAAHRQAQVLSPPCVMGDSSGLRRPSPSTCAARSSTAPCPTDRCSPRRTSCASCSRSASRRSARRCASWNPRASSPCGGATWVAPSSTGRRHATSRTRSAWCSRRLGVTIDQVAAALREIEPACAALCARRRDRKREVVPELRRLHQRYLDSIDHLVEVVGWSRTFHESLVSLCGNAPLIVTAGALESMWSAHEKGWASRIAEDDPVHMSERLAAAEVHERIIELIAEGDAEGVRRVAAEHLSHAQRNPTPAHGAIRDRPRPRPQPPRLNWCTLCHDDRRGNDNTGGTSHGSARGQGRDHHRIGRGQGEAEAGCSPPRARRSCSATCSTTSARRSPPTSVTPPATCTST